MASGIWDQIEGQWKQLKGQVRTQWGKLTDDDLEQIAGRRDTLAGKLQERYGIAKEEANRQIDRWAQNLRF
ncbi:MAG: CsbD family protein [Chloroflexi bacterium]|nr:CsbD family protein [Chloroflexota bacterium]